MGDGRFGPLFEAHDAGGLAVVVRTFTEPLTDVQRTRFLSALRQLCETPLDHPSIARPLAFGVEDEQPYLVHTYLPGTSLLDYIGVHGRPALGDVILRLTYLAGALDFAAAAGVHHGVLSAADVIFSSDNAGISGFGLAQAMEAAGVSGFHATRADDIAALMSIAAELIGRDAPSDVRAILAAPPPMTALEFASALHRMVGVRVPARPPRVEPVDSPVADTEQHVNPTWSGSLVESETLVGRTLPGLPDVVPQDVAPPDGAADLDFAAETQPTLIAPRLSGLEVEAFESEASPTFDIPLREGEPARKPQVVDVSEEPSLTVPEPSLFGVAPSEMAVGSPVRRRSSGKWLLAAIAVLALVLFVGFAGGFFVGRDVPNAPTVAVVQPPPPEPANGRAFTEAPVDDTPRAAQPAPEKAPPTPTPSPSRPAASASNAPSATPNRPTPAPEPPRSQPTAPRQTSPARAARQDAAAPVPTGPAAMRVESLPAGAQVFVDGRSVGYAPLIVADLTPGTHSIRMQLPGYRPWVSAVTLAPGARERVAASLEQ